MCSWERAKGQLQSWTNDHCSWLWNSCQYHHQGAKAIQWRKAVFSKASAEETGHPYAKTMKADTDLTPFPNINSKWIIDLKCKMQSYSLVEKSRWTWVWRRLLDTTLNVRSMKEKKWISWTLLKFKTSAEDTVREWKEKTQTRRKHFKKHVSDRKLVSKIWKEMNLNNEKTNNLTLKWTKDLNRSLTKENNQMANKRTKRCSTSFVIRELQTATIMLYRYTS